MIYENMTLRAQLSDKVFKQKDNTKGTSLNTQFCKQSILGKPHSFFGLKLYSVTPSPKSKGLPKINESHALSKTVTLNSVPTPQESKVVKNNKVIAPGMFRINPFKTSREEKHVPNKPTKASVRRKPITVSQPHVDTKKYVNFDSNGFSSIGVNITAKTRRPQPRSNTKNDRVPSASKSSCIKNKEVEVEEHHRNLLLSKNKKHMSFECNNVKPAIRNGKTEVVCPMCKQCLITVNHVVCMLKHVNDMNSRGQKQNPEVKKPKKVGTKERLASPTPSEPSITRRNLIANGFQIPPLFLAGYPNLFMEQSALEMIMLLQFWVLVIFNEFYDSDLDVTFRRNTLFVRNLKGVDLLNTNHSTKLYTINLHDMAYASPICLMPRATSTKSWLWHRHLSHLNFDTINDLARNDLVTGLPKFKCHEEHLCPSCEQGKSKKASHPPKLVPNSKQRLHLLHMDLCGPMRIASIKGKRYWKLGAKGDIGFFNGYAGDSCAYRVNNRRTKKNMDTMNVTFDELSAMAFEQSSSKPGL
uniref:Integrase, catalytic region, zinc finger, CCHC-type, peptidase aspartic, catalytic n=1 Tax=Tanacetum cinerariifolium TaxID=118510 RepID=A0A6L2JBW6_TANCI|nr:integrase, catalytic region, zinc finger, CCHC-type, peptidase aspartic, catalytic [Tanacetum cinerariifolium]